MIVLFFLLFELILLFLLSKTLTRSLTSLFFRIFKSQRLTVNLLAVLFLPGVIIHELSHLLIAGIMMVPTGDIEFLPKLNPPAGGGGEVKLGSVAIAKTDIVRRTIIGVAPFFAGLSIIFLSLFYLNSINLPISYPLKLLIEVYLIFQVANTMFSSRKDMEGVIELFLVVIFFLIILFIIGLRPPQFVWDYLFSEKVVSAVRGINLLLLVPLGIDVIVIGGTRIINRK